MKQASPIDPNIKKVADARIDPAAKERKDIRYFGGSFLVILGAITAFAFWRKPGHWLTWMWIPAIAVGVPALLYPPCMKPLFKVWMLIGGIIGFVMSRILFSVFFYIAIFPMAMVMKLFGRDYLGLKFPEEGKSNWTEVQDSANDPKHFEHMF
ncbi:MAG: SxtJ family membrane protein [Planctomycetota bacterium]|jgi:hypothetical protein